MSREKQDLICKSTSYSLFNMKLFLFSRENINYCRADELEYHAPSG